MKKVISKILPALMVITFIGCKEEKNPCSISEAILKNIDKEDSLINLPEVKKRDSIWNLKTYNEPSLITAQNDSYRFTLASAFEGVHIYRVEKNNDHYKATIKFIADPGIEPVVKEFSIPGKTWNNIVDSLAADSFWTYPSSIDRSGLDGATWVLEGYKSKPDRCTGKNYHRLMRWSPIDSTFIAMCDLLYHLKKE
ncbi:hypothetical protein [Ferruginibacter sp.]